MPCKGERMGCVQMSVLPFLSYGITRVTSPGLCVFICKWGDVLSTGSMPYTRVYWGLMCEQDNAQGAAFVPCT